MVQDAPPQCAVVVGGLRKESEMIRRRAVLAPTKVFAAFVGGSSLFQHSSEG